ncbi:hypothetical protein FNU76_06405 [Chitinimonas arctica]|uniref:Uncharacterized protein n=1 Tax=Chitinimonas arctica TaxID=2594795 RepID=A0A516SCY0_9NEIS|nr:hypothetical protein [Chitinimonas arctica]QDQ26013.1 hypothetical protein FNU76_06405 [Chitinimonas arctica]
MDESGVGTREYTENMHRSSKDAIRNKSIYKNDLKVKAGQPEACPQSSQVEVGKSTEQNKAPDKPRFVKVAGSPFDPRNWPTFIKYARHGKPQRTVGIRPLTEGTGVDATTPGFVIDGFDDLANIFQGSGLSQHGSAILQAFVFYPLILPLVNLGATGSRDELADAKRGYLDGIESLNGARGALIEAIQLIEPDLEKDLKDISDAKMCTYLLTNLKRLSNNAGDENRRLGVLHALANFKSGLDQHLLSAVKYRATPALVLGAHAMLGGVLLYQAGALANFVATSCAQSLVATAAADAAGGSALANFSLGTGAQGAAGVLGLGGHLAMGVGQAAVALYGVALAGWGVKKQIGLAAQKKIIAGSCLDKATKTDLFARLGTQNILNIVGGIVANLVLSAGQVLMLLGGPLIGFGLPFLLTGGGLTILAIVTKMRTQALGERYFGYEQREMDAIAEVVLSAPSFEAAAISISEIRERSMQRVIWNDISKELGKIKAKYPNGEEPDLRNLANAAIQRLYRQGHEKQMNVVMQELIKDAEFNFLIDKVLLSTDSVALSSYISLMHAKSEPGKTSLWREEVDTFERLGLGQKMQKLLAMSESEGLDGEVQQHLVQELVIKQRGKAFDKDSMGERYLEKQEHVEERKWWWNKKKTAYSLNMVQLRTDLEKNENLAKDCQDKVCKAISKAIHGGLSHRLHSQWQAARDGALRLAEAEDLSRNFAKQGQHGEAEKTGSAAALF